MRIVSALSILAAIVAVATAGPPDGAPQAAGAQAPKQVAASLSPEQEVRVLKERLQTLEDEVARLRQGASEKGPLTLKTYGPTSNEVKPGSMSLYANQTTVLGERGVPSRVEWTAHRRVFYYGRERWEFDQDGQLVSVQRDQ